MGDAQFLGVQHVSIHIANVPTDDILAEPPSRDAHELPCSKFQSPCHRSKLGRELINALGRTAYESLLCPKSHKSLHRSEMTRCAICRRSSHPLDRPVIDAFREISRGRR